jgi:hypothetical protein
MSSTTEATENTEATEATEATEGWIAKKSPRRTDGGPAFPQKHLKWTDQLSGKECVAIGFEGMSLRDWFAGQALQGQAHRFAHPHEHRELLAKDCYDIADAMLAARKESEK